ncbi:hypothetical protein [Nonomuraea sp. NPDC049646]
MLAAGAGAASPGIQIARELAVGRSMLYRALEDGDPGSPMT